MSVMLTGLDGSNPLGFMAALGTARALQGQGIEVRLSWQDDGVWRPVLHGVDDLEQVIELLLLDLESWADEPALDLQYPNAKSGKLDRDLKPPPEVFREFAKKMRQRGGRSAALVAAFGSSMALDNGGAVKPTALHFYAGQQRFLSAVRELRERIEREDLVEALRGPWRFQSPLPVLGWHAGGAREHALRAFDPSGDKKLGVPGADWLAFCSLPLFPVAPGRKGLQTTGASGSWKHGDWTWPLWGEPLPLTVIASLIQQGAALAGMAPERRTAWGVVEVCSSAIHRTDQGGYGSFSPSKVL